MVPDSAEPSSLLEVLKKCEAVDRLSCPLLWYRQVSGMPLGQTHLKGTAQRDPRGCPQWSPQRSSGPAHLWVVQDNDFSVGGLQLLLPLTQGHSNHVSFLQKRTPTLSQLEVCPSMLNLLGDSPPSFQYLLSTLCKRSRDISWRSSRVIPGSPAESV